MYELARLVTFFFNSSPSSYCLGAIIAFFVAESVVIAPFFVCEVCMTFIQLALFKFRNVEGVLENWKPYEATSSIYHKGQRRVLVTYDMKNDTADIQDNNQTYTNIKITDLVKKLDDLGLVKERIENRHSCSYTKEK